MNHQLLRDEGHRKQMTVPELEQRMAGYLRDGYSAVLFEEPDGVAGYALYRIDPEFAYLRQFFVGHDYRQRGIRARGVHLAARESVARAPAHPSGSAGRQPARHPLLALDRVPGLLPGDGSGAVGSRARLGHVRPIGGAPPTRHVREPAHRPDRPRPRSAQASLAGLFFAFSAFVMDALGRLPPAQGIAAMQSINLAVLNPMFLTAVRGTAALSALLAVGALLGWAAASALSVVAGALLYIVRPRSA